MATQREKIKFRVNTPETIELCSATSKPMPGREGMQYMRVCDNDERIIFCEPELEAEITASGARKGDAIQITHKGGTRWEVRILQEPGQQPAAAAARPARENTAGLTEPSLAAARTVNTEATEMTAAFVAAIESAKAAEEYAARVNLRDFRLDTGDIKSLAITIYIQRGKR